MHRKTDFDNGPSGQGKGDVNQRFAALVKRERGKRGLSQQNLSLSLERGPKYIWRLENGYAEADLYEFVEIMEALGIYPPDGMRELVG
jgi:ribosome-binding protein aMBF1 (putative translation factor)